MQIPYQKNFYDRKRYFQDKDNPGDWHPDPNRGSKGIPVSQMVIGALFFAFIAGLFLLNIRGSHVEVAPEPAPAAAAPAAPAKK